MNKSIKTEDIAFSNHEIKFALEKMDSGQSIKITRLVFYPYYFFEYTLKRKNFFHPLGGSVGCTVDGINGVSALIDTSPDCKERVRALTNIIHARLDVQESRGIAESFLYNSISYKMKVLTMPKLKLARQEMFYRPYWIAESSKNDSNQFLLTVDAVTGKYHPL